MVNKFLRYLCQSMRVQKSFKPPISFDVCKQVHFIPQLRLLSPKILPPAHWFAEQFAQVPVSDLERSLLIHLLQDKVSDTFYVKVFLRLKTFHLMLTDSANCTSLKFNERYSSRFNSVRINYWSLFLWLCSVETFKGPHLECKLLVFVDQEVDSPVDDKNHSCCFTKSNSLFCFFNLHFCIFFKFYL